MDARPKGVAVLTTSLKFGLALILLSRALAAHAQTEPPLLRFDFTPLVGYRTSMSFTGPPEGEGMNLKVVLDPSPSYGMALGARINEEDLIELRWARQKTHIRLEEAFVT